LKIAGFTIIKNAVKYGYPVVESIISALPLCDAFYVSIGDGEDNTEELIRSINSEKIVILQSIWDKSLTKNGEVLAAETNKAFQQIPSTYDWCLYLQADEALHEQDYVLIQASIQKASQMNHIDGILFNYKHFWGSFDYIGSTSRWYRKEIRLIKNNKSIFSYKDAQGFRKLPNEKLNVIETKAAVYHYGWVRPPKKMQAKNAGIQQYWSDNKNFKDLDEFDYSNIDGLDLFEGTHPAVMKSHIAAQDWTFVFDKKNINLKPKERFKKILYQLTGKHFFEYKNYNLIK
jgi:hypothetical protein